MRIIAAYLLAVLGGNANPTEKDITTILGAVGIEADGAQVSKLVSELKGKNMTQYIDLVNKASQRFQKSR